MMMMMSDDRHSKKAISAERRNIIVTQKVSDTSRHADLILSYYRYIMSI